MKKVVLLTLWLLLPILVVGGLTAWVFISMDKDKPMMDLPALGAGAGDTGGVNAIGEMLHGNDPDAIQHAKRAQQEQILMDPREWPGGVLIRVPIEALEDPGLGARVTVLHDASGDRSSVGGVAADGWFGFRFELGEMKGSRFVIWAAEPEVVSQDGYHGSDNRLLKMLALEERVPPRDLSTSEPWVIEMRIGSVYEDSP